MVSAMHYNHGNGATTNGASKSEPGALPAPASPAPLAGEDEVAQVMLGYQNLMARFLDTQRSVMLAYLQGDAGPVPFLPPATPNAQPNGAAPQSRKGHAPPNGAADMTPAAAPKPAENGHVSNGNGKSESHAPSNRLHPAAAAPPAPQPETQLAKAAAPATQAKPSFDREEVSKQLLDLVSERTGYPHEMLDVDLDLEADLGIDSIKRVEILGNLAELLGISQDGGSAKIEFERLTSIRTIRGILDYLQEALQAATAEPVGRISNPSPAPAAKPDVEEEGRIENPSYEEELKKNDSRPGVLDIQRGLVELIDAPLPARSSPLIPSGAVLLTDDGRGVAVEVAHRLADFGQETVLIRHTPDGNRADGDGVFYADLTDEAAVVALGTRIRKAVGSVGGLIHLLPLADESGKQKAESGEPEKSRERSVESREPEKANALPSLGRKAEDLGRMAREVKGLFLLAREFSDDLRQAGRDGGSLLLAATALGGGLGIQASASSKTFFAGHGGMAGLLKVAALEWPEVLVRAVDVDGARAAEELAECFLAELNDRQGPREIGYLGNRRVTWRAADGAFPADREFTSLIDSTSTLLVTGGGRGITSAIAEELARQFQPNLVLVGRSPAPQGEEPNETAHLNSPAEIKAVLIARRKQNGQPVTPGEVQAEYARLMRDREIRGTLERIRTAGSRVMYRSADVRDEAAMAAVIEEARTQFGGIDGVIHGAGVIEDKLLCDKTPESFDRVFGAKVESALILLRLLDLERLKFCAFFASVASRFGNRGQCDYAAANEVLAKLAWQLDRETSCRVFALDWGPWSGIGMASSLEKHMVARGVEMISPEVGVRFFVEELCRGRKGESEVIVGGGAERLAATPSAEAAMA
jgi:NAD(P)-dependent dehydrogenase (short-subunit alcohol dehydrogenase family)/acyl carrier protein